MPNATPSHFRSGVSTADPRVREEMVSNLQQFHQEQLQALGPDKMLRVYCQALSNWVLNPNTEPYQVEMLFDEVCHTASQAHPDADTDG